MNSLYNSFFHIVMAYPYASCISWALKEMSNCLVSSESPEFKIPKVVKGYLTHLAEYQESPGPC